MGGMKTLKKLTFYPVNITTVLAKREVEMDSQ